MYLPVGLPQASHLVSWRFPAARRIALGVCSSCILLVHSRPFICTRQPAFDGFGTIDPRPQTPFSPASFLANPNFSCPSTSLLVAGKCNIRTPPFRRRWANQVCICRSVCVRLSPAASLAVACNSTSPSGDSQQAHATTSWHQPPIRASACTSLPQPTGPPHLALSDIFFFPSLPPS